MLLYYSKKEKDLTYINVMLLTKKIKHIVIQKRKRLSIHKYT
jgi:hypothetical protein